MANVRELDEYRNSKVPSNNGGGGGMDEYATLKDLKNLEEKINFKIELMEKDIKMMFYEEREHHRKNKIDSIKWTVGTGIAVVGLIFTYIRFFVVK